jgi:hypothetical protein
MTFLRNLFGQGEFLGIISFKRILTPFAIVKYLAPRNKADFKCVYVFGIRVAYFTN